MSEIRFTLYIAGDSPRSDRAVRNLRRLADAHLAGRYALRVVDIVADPDVAEVERILTTPTLVKESPAPRRRVTGDLGDAEQVLVALSLIPAQEL